MEKSSVNYSPLAHIQALLRGFPLFWQAAPLEMSLLLFTLLLQGGIPPLSVWISKQVVDQVRDLLEESAPSDWGHLPALVVLWTVALAANAVFSPIAQANWGNLRDRIRAHFDQVLMSKARSFLDVARFEESRFYDQLQILQRQSQEEPISLASVVVQFGQQLVTVVALCGLLVPLAAWIPVLLLATTLPQAIVALRLQKQIWDLTEDHSPHAPHELFQHSDAHGYLRQRSPTVQFE